MANGDLSRAVEFDKIECVGYNIQVRRADCVMEEQSDGSKTEISRAFHRHVLTPYLSSQDDDGAWTHTDTDISGEDATVQAIATAAWTDAAKARCASDSEAAGL